MPRPLRAEVFNPNEIGIVHCQQRCVRRAFLTGEDPLSGRNFDHRRELLRARMERLASVFGIDVLNYAILSNHLHVILRTRPDVVAQWSDEDVVSRWLSLYPKAKVDEFLGTPTRSGIDSVIHQPAEIARIREQLSNPSWFMRALCEPIARVANEEDQCTGRFWEGRFKAQAIRDEAGLLACSMYVDLNPIRAAMANCPSQAVHTSAYDRIAGLRGETMVSAASERVVIETEEAGKLRRTLTPSQLRAYRTRSARMRRGRSVLRDSWLSPLTVEERSSPGPQISTSGLRASDKGYLSLTLKSYLELLDWTSKHRPSLAKQHVPEQVAPILTRLGIEGSMWLDLVWGFSKYFRGAAVGTPTNLAKDAAQHQRRWRRGQRAAAQCFSSA